jgi:hypothetical protein
MNPTETRVYLGFSRFFSPSTFTIALHAWDLSGTKKWEYNITSPYTGTVYKTRTVDSSNSFILWFVSYSQDFVKITDNDTSASVAWARKVSAGNTISRIAIESTGNVYVATTSGLNVYITKVDSSGTAQWTTRLTHLTAPTGSIRYTIGLHQMTATPRALYLSVSGMRQDIDTKGYWNDVGQYDATFLCVPTDGSKTGTHLNVKYETAGTLALTSQTAPTLTSNAMTNVAISSANTGANTMTLTQNNTLNLTATII